MKTAGFLREGTLSSPFQVLTAARAAKTSKSSKLFITCPPPKNRDN
jgi:hypothetical protein